VTWIFYLSSSKVEHIVLVIKMSLRVIITLSNALTTVSLTCPFTSSKVEHVGLVVISWLMSSCPNQDFFVLVNVKLS